MVFTGYCQHAIDAKNRLAIPAKFRAKVDPERDGKYWVIVYGQPPDRLWLYPDRYFEGLATRAVSALIPDRDLLRFDQMFFPAAETQELDSQGRIVVPERMVRRANLGREVVICGVRDHLEVRRHEGFEEELAEGWAKAQELQLKASEAYQRSGGNPAVRPDRPG
jgi:MraZ protein